MFAQAAADPHRQRHRLQPAADHRPVDQRRLRISARGARGTGPGEPRQRDAGHRRRGQPGPAPGARVLDLHRDQPVDLSRHRPRQGAGAGPQHQRRVHRAASRRSAASSSTTSTSTAAPGRSISRARRPTGATSPTSGRSTCATRPARWCRCARSPTLRIVTGPQVITRYNNYRSVTINGSPAPGASSGDGAAAMEEVSAQTLPPGYAFEWTGTAFQEHEARGPDRPDPRAWRWCSPSCSWSGSTRAG